jgi:hypothetical protein
MYKKIINQLIIFILLLSLGNCFEIIHSIQKNKDNTIDVFWIFSISSNLAKDPSNPTNPSDQITKKIENSEQEIIEKLGKSIEKLTISNFENEHEVGVKISYSIKDIKLLRTNKEFDEGLPIAPRFTKNNEMVFNFLPDKEKREKLSKENQNNKKPDSNDPDMNTEESQMFNDSNQMEKIMGTILSSASYMIFLGGEFNPKTAHISSKVTKKKTQLSIIKIGDQSLIKIPFISLLMTEKEGFEVIVKY